MKKVNLRDLYPDVYKTDHFVEVTEDVLPEKQAKRIYARYYLGMRVSEIAAAEGVDPSRVRESIRRGLRQLAKYF
ncbi:MAG: sigma factor-like helix-turn-helix DNA-binding protein [Hungatella hathewayi]|nr:sigma factor-like helix-turn-helix DNA-binding protein [Hungatella hathewayi]